MRADRIAADASADGFGPWLTARQAARYLCFDDCKDPVKAFRMWVRRAPPIETRYRGDVPLYYRRSLDDAIAKGRWTMRYEKGGCHA